MRIRHRSRRLLWPLLLERCSSVPRRSPASRHWLRRQFRPDYVVHHVRVSGESAVSSLFTLRASQERISLWAFTWAASAYSVSHHGRAPRISKHARKKDLTMRWSERRTAVCSTFEMTSTLPPRTTRALVRRRSSCSR